MISLNKLPKITKRKKKRIGRGYGSGVGGHTTIRGAKGMKARGKVPLTFDGAKIKKSWLKRLPFWRGKGRQKSLEERLIFNLDVLENNFKNGDKVNLKSLIKKGLLKRSQSKLKVKILSRGKITKSLEVDLPCSERAIGKIKKAGGKVN